MSSTTVQHSARQAGTARQASTARQAGTARQVSTVRSKALGAPSRGVRLTGRGRMLVRVVLAAVLVLAASLGAVAMARAAGQGQAAPAPRVVVVQPGETLWELGQKIAPGRDPRDTVAAIRRINHLDSAAVQAGQRLTLPSS